MTIIGDNIRKARLEKNYTQKYVAGQLELSVHAYGNIETGKSDINIRRLQQLAGILEKSPEELVGNPQGKATDEKEPGDDLIGIREDTLVNLTNTLKELCSVLKGQ